MCRGHIEFTPARYLDGLTCAINYLHRDGVRPIGITLEEDYFNQIVAALSIGLPPGGNLDSFMFQGIKFTKEKCEI